jgi:predicted Zn-dependent peptidase
VPQETREATSRDGHRVVLVPALGRHSVAVELVAAGGAVTDPRGQEGSAALAASLLCEGTDERDATAWRAALEEIGAQCWTGVTAAALRVSITVPSATLEQSLAIAAESLVSQRVSEPTLGRVRRQGIALARQAAVTPATRALHELRYRVHAASSRMRLPLSGTEESLDAVSIAAVEQHRIRALSRPVTLVICGDVQMGPLLRLVDRVLPAPMAAEPSSPPGPAPAWGDPRSVWVQCEDLTQCQVVLGAVAIERGHPDWAALRIGLHSVAGSLGSRVDAVLRERLGVTYGVRSGLRSRAGDALLTIGGGVEARAAETSIDHIRGVLQEVTETGLTEVEAATAAGYVAGSAVVRLADPRAVVESIADRVEAGLPTDSIGAELAELRCVTADRASAALSRWANPATLSAAVVGPGAARTSRADYELVND